ncbi:MAG: hypothetical protein JST39_11860, partial [Bacteroidetes bacterium]|nr:hypothetical protein [Bacteroidota bacterium]
CWRGQNSLPAIPRLFVAGPACALEKDKPYEFTAVYEGSGYGRPEWHLFREDRIKELHSLKVSAYSNKIWVSLPEQHARYRLYVYLDDGHGNVITSSTPLVPYNGIYNQGL